MILLLTVNSLDYKLYFPSFQGHSDQHRFKWGGQEGRHIFTNIIYMQIVIRVGRSFCVVILIFEIYISENSFMLYVLQE